MSGERRVKTRTQPRIPGMKGQATQQGKSVTVYGLEGCRNGCQIRLIPGPGSQVRGLSPSPSIPHLQLLSQSRQTKSCAHLTPFHSAWLEQHCDQGQRYREYQAFRDSGLGWGRLCSPQGLNSLEALAGEREPTFSGDLLSKPPEILSGSIKCVCVSSL